MFQVLAARLVVAGLNRAQVGIERRLHVHHDLAPVGHAHDHVGTHAAFLGVRVFLFVEVAVLDHAGQLGEALQRHLAPLAAHLGPAQRLHQIARLALQQLLGLDHGFEMLGERAVGLLALVFHQADLLLGFFQRLAHRLDEVLDCFFLEFQIALGLHVELLERFLRQLQERGVVFLERAAGEGDEILFQPGEFFLCRLALQFQRGSKLREAFLRPQPCEQPAEHARQQNDDSDNNKCNGVTHSVSASREYPPARESCHPRPSVPGFHGC